MQIFYPQSDLLKKYIDCFYVLQNHSQSTYSYIAFPHYYTCLSLIKGAVISSSKYQMDISEYVKDNVCIVFTGKYVSPVKINYAGRFQEISIIFKPFGINRFIKNIVQNVDTQHYELIQNEEWQAFANQLKFDTDGLQNLEAFLITQFQEDVELLKLQPAIALLEDLKNSMPIPDIANRLGYTTKTFQRHFIKYMGCTPVVYRRIYRFRHAIDSKYNDITLKSLTELTYESGYFDQSYLIKEFQKLTHHNPKDFFKESKPIDGKIIWKLL